MELELTDRVAIVTGASAGIGRATVEFLAERGLPTRPGLWNASDTFRQSAH